MQAGNATKFIDPARHKQARRYVFGEMLLWSGSLLAVLVLLAALWILHGFNYALMISFFLMGGGMLYKSLTKNKEDVLAFSIGLGLIWLGVVLPLKDLLPRWYFVFVSVFVLFILLALIGWKITAVAERQLRR
jgi:hypothetical protein